MEQREFEITVKMPVTANSSVRVPQRIKFLQKMLMQQLGKLMQDMEQKMLHKLLHL